MVAAKHHASQSGRGLCLEAEKSQSQSLSKYDLCTLYPFQISMLCLGTMSEGRVGPVHVLYAYSTNLWILILEAILVRVFFLEKSII